MNGEMYKHILHKNLLASNQNVEDEVKTDIPEPLRCGDKFCGK